MKLAIAGSRYVGLTLAWKLAQQNEVVALGIDHEKVDFINVRKSTIEYELCQEAKKYFLPLKKADHQATYDDVGALNNANGYEPKRWLADYILRLVEWHKLYTERV